MQEGFAPGLQLGRVGLLLKKELQRRGGGEKEIPQEVQIFYYFLFVQSMSTLGTRCAICLELRCQLEKMSFLSPDLTQKEPEHKKKKNISERAGRDGLQGMRGDHGRAAETVAQSKPPPLSAPRTPWRCSLLGCGSFRRAHLGVFNTVVQLSWSLPIQASSPSPTRGSGSHPLPCNFSPNSTRFQTPQKFFLGTALVKRLAQGLR